MNNKDKAYKSICTEIYQEETEAHIKLFKRFLESWIRSPKYFKTEMFKYGDDDFYFYRFLVNRLDHNKPVLLNSILYKVLSEYKVNFLIPDIKEHDFITTSNEVPFEFIIDLGTNRLGYRYDDFYIDEDIPEILKEHKVDKVYIIHTINEEIDTYITKNENPFIEKITLKSFFEQFINLDEYQEFKKYITNYVSEIRKLIGYSSMKTLSAMNLATQKVFEKKILKEWDYISSKYHILDEMNEKIVEKKLTYLKDYDLDIFWNEIKNNYLDSKLYETMVGSESYAESFITSEWLYYSLKGKGNFDYTSIISGYLKSIEQLLYKLTLLNIDSGCVIVAKKDKKTKADIIKNKIPVYEMKNYEKKPCDLSKNSFPKYPYIDFTKEQEKYMDSSIGTFQHFFRNNSNAFYRPELAKIVCDLIDCFRIECRNGYFHTHNLHDSDVVDKTRENAILLYAILIGTIKQTKTKKRELGIIVEDKFDSICKEIRELRHYSIEFIFEYENGTQKKMIYDRINNTIEYTEDGVEHYENLVFFEVDDFSLETYQRLDSGEMFEKRYLLTKENLPQRIYCFDIRKELHEVSKECFYKSEP